MKTLKCISLALVIIGAVNWGLIGLFRYNLVSALLGTGSFLEALIYILVGIAGIISLFIFSDLKD